MTELFPLEVRGGLNDSQFSCPTASNIISCMSLFTFLSTIFLSTYFFIDTVAPR